MCWADHGRALLKNLVRSEPIVFFRPGYGEHPQSVIVSVIRGLLEETRVRWICNVYTRELRHDRTWHWIVSYMPTATQLICCGPTQEVGQMA